MQHHNLALAELIAPSAKEQMAHIRAQMDTPGLKTNRKILKLLKRALLAVKKENYADVCTLALEALDIDETNAQANHIMAIGLEKLGELHKSLQMYERALKFDPNDSELYFNLSHVASRLKMFPQAEKLLRLFVQMEPGRDDGFNNLAICLRDQGKFDDAVDVLKVAIMQTPERPVLWNTLGTILMDQSRMDEAQTFIREAIRLAPDFSRAFHNLGFLLNHTGPLDESLQMLDKAIELGLPISEQLETQQARAICLFHMGRIDEALEQWEVRNDPRFRESWIYQWDLPQWQGEDLKGKTVLLVAEQGLGDEIMFANALPDVADAVGPEGKLLISCDKRLVPLYERSFPGAFVGAPIERKTNMHPVKTLPWLEAEGPADYWALFGSTLRHFRKSIGDFGGRPAVLTPDPERVAYWTKRLAEIGEGPFVGLSWKSLMMSQDRARYYSPIETWKPVLTAPGAHFINLQYGECAEDIKEAQDKFGVTIHDFEEIDLKNDLDDNAALCAALHLVITSPNAASALAGGVGTEVWFITMCEVWPQLGTDHMPWYPKTKVFNPEAIGDFTDALARAGEDLATFAQSSRAA